MPYFDTNNGNNTYDSGQVYDQPGPVLANTNIQHMNKVKLDLSNKNEAETIELGTNHKAEMAGNANFATPMPPVAEFDATLAAAVTAVADVDSKKAAWRGAVATKNQALHALRTALTTRGNYVDTASEGDAAIILSSGFDVRGPATPPQPLPAPTNVEAEMGAMEGTIDLGWEPVPGAGSYVVEQSANVLPRVFNHTQVVTRADFTATGLTSGQRYVFRVAAVGPLGQGPWSDEAGKMAP